MSFWDDLANVGTMGAYGAVRNVAGGNPGGAIANWGTMGASGVMSGNSGGPNPNVPFSYAGMPAYPGFNRITGENGRLPGQLETNPNFDNRSMDAFRKRAMGGTSPWASMMLDKRGIETAQAQDEMTGKGMGALAAANSHAQMHGGLDSGAAERNSRDMVRQSMMGGQDIRRQGEISKMDILTQDDKTKMAMLGELPGMEDRRTGLQMDSDKFNVGNALGEKRAEDLARVNEYNQQAAMWGAGKSADATEHGGKKG